MSRLTRDGTAEPVSRDQVISRERRQGNVIRERNREIFIFLVQLTTSKIGNLARLMLILDICVTIHTYIHIYIHAY